MGIPIIAAMLFAFFVYRLVLWRARQRREFAEYQALMIVRADREQQMVLADDERGVYGGGKAWVDPPGWMVQIHRPEVSSVELGPAARLAQVRWDRRWER